MAIDDDPACIEMYRGEGLWVLDPNTWDESRVQATERALRPLEETT